MTCDCNDFTEICLVVLWFLHDGHRRQIETLQTLGDLAPAGEVQFHERQSIAINREIQMIEHAPQ